MTVSEYYGSITKWQSGVDTINNQNCFAINFGFNEEIPLPTLSFSSQVHQQIDNFFNFGKDYKCYYIFVGGKYLQEMKTVMNVVEGITDQFHGIKPKAMFLIGKYSTPEIVKISSFINDLTMVRWGFKKRKKI